MPDTTSHQPRQYLGVMVSSRFKDLEKHRAALLDALRKEELFAIGMEDYVPVPGDDVISSSLNMVNKGAAYIGLISHRCGQVIECAIRNSKSYSVTRLEFEQALKLGLPTLIFVMSQEHEVKPAHVDRDAENIAKLNEFRTAAKSGRIYIEFDSLEDFTPKAIHAVASLRRYIEDHSKSIEPATLISPPTDAASTIPHPPAFYAEPDYIGSHQFVGRQAELDALSDWANRSDPTNLLLFEAIGGNGKSMLTWEWTTKHATTVRTDWAGRFWYSFYERGAIMQDFCQRALAYMTVRPLKEFEKRKTTELKDELIAQLHARPWLLILDGLERVLVAYHRIDAAEVRDEDLNRPTDKILDRNPCDAIRDEDSDLIRALAACAPSKILVSSRLTPRILLNPSNQAIQGIKRLPLAGLRPPDAEALLRQCGITGDSVAIQDYLQQNCDNHPLVIGILAGLIANYLPDRGNFDTWSVDPSGGAVLDLAKLDLIQRRNHILQAAIADLPDASRQLLSTLALLSESTDYETLKALNPYLPLQPEKTARPISPKRRLGWELLAPKEKTMMRREHIIEVANWKSVRDAAKSRLDAPECIEAAMKLPQLVKDLEQRGLLQFNLRAKRYDIHPVVRSVSTGGLSQLDQNRYRQRVVDHFSQRAKDPYTTATSREDLRYGLVLVRALVQMGRVERAIAELKGGLLNALIYKVEDHSEALALLRPFFDQKWGPLSAGVGEAWLSQQAAVTLKNLGELELAQDAYVASLLMAISHSKWILIRSGIAGIGATLFHRNQLARMCRCYQVALDFAVKIAKEMGDQLMLTIAANNCFKVAATIGRWAQAESMLALRDSAQFVPRLNQERALLAKMQLDLMVFHFYRGNLRTNDFNLVAQNVEVQGNRTSFRDLNRLRGSWRLEQHDYPLAVTSFQDAVSMARERRLVDAESETGLALAKHHLGQLTGDAARSEAERLAGLRDPAHRTLALLWVALGDRAKAEHHALASYRWAWADGEPYVHRFELTKTTELLQQMKVPVPVLPPYDPAMDVPFPWEADVRAAIEKLKAEKEKK